MLPMRTVLIIATAILLLVIGVVTGLAVMQTLNLQDLEIPVAGHWSSTDCADSFSSSASFTLPLLLYLGIGLGMLAISFLLRLIPIKYMNVGTPSLKEQILRHPEKWPLVYDLVSLLIIVITIPIVLFTFIMLMPGYDWNMKCADSIECSAAVKQGSDKICCSSFTDMECAGWWDFALWGGLAFCIATPLVLSLMWVVIVRRKINERTSEDAGGLMGKGRN